MKKLLLLVGIGMVAMTGCKKDKSQPKNQSSDHLKVKIVGKWTLNGKDLIFPLKDDPGKDDVHGIIYDKGSYILFRKDDSFKEKVNFGGTTIDSGTYKIKNKRLFRTYESGKPADTFAISKLTDTDLEIKRTISPYSDPNHPNYDKKIIEIDASK